jgi:glucose/arabinose dehydrogenase
MTLQFKLILAAVIAALAFSAGWTVKGWQASKAIAELRAEQAQGAATRAEAARTDETQTAIKESKHAQDTIYNADRLANLKTGIDVDVRAELARAERLHRDTDSRSATYRAQAKADAAARSDLADKAAALDRQLAEGLGVVASLGGDLRRRDAEVAALCDQVNIERRLTGDDSDQACSQK